MGSDLTASSNSKNRYGRNISPASNFWFSAIFLITNQILLEINLEPPYSFNTQGGPSRFGAQRGLSWEQQHFTTDT